MPGGKRRRHHGRVDVDEALEVAAPALQLWEVHSENPSVPLFSGGLMDAWPAWALDALSICREELAAVRAYVADEEAKDSKSKVPKGRR